MSRWFSRVPSTPAWAAATPIPGTTIAWMSIRPLAGKPAKRPWGTHVADATMSRPVRASMAITDQVADAIVGSSARASNDKSTQRVGRMADDMEKLLRPRVWRVLR